MYLQGIHAGIQSQHCTAEMFVKYAECLDGEDNLLYDWAENHKTTIVLNGGYASALYELSVFLDDDDENPYPWAYFKESEEALDGCITNVGIILPDKIFNYSQIRMDLLERNQWLNTYPAPRDLNGRMGYTDWEIELAEKVEACKLMT